MLYSMTGFGEASFQSDDLSLAIELRSVNNRYLKVTLCATEPYNLLEPEFEKIIRRLVRRGTIQVHMRLHRQASAQDYQINSARSAAISDSFGRCARSSAWKAACSSCSDRPSRCPA